MNNRKLKKVIVTGFGCSGASVVVDWLREMDCCHVFPEEWDFFRHPDGVQDLRSALTERVSIRRCYLAMQRFRRLAAVVARPRTYQFGRNYEAQTFPGFAQSIDEFLEALVAIRYPAWRTGDWIENHNRSDTEVDTDAKYHRYSLAALKARLYRRAHGSSMLESSLARYLLALLGMRLPARSTEMYQPLALSPDEFDTIARRHFDRMAERMTPGNRTHLVLDQAFFASGLREGLELMSDCRAVVIHRDPRDVLMSGFKDKRDWIPTDSAESFAHWFRIAMPLVDLKDPRVCVIAFEDLVLKPDRAQPLLLDFLGIDASRHIYQGKHFDPTRSAANTGKWRAHSDQEFVQSAWELTQENYQGIRSQGVTL